jgi:hypothetical protein
MAESKLRTNEEILREIAEGKKKVERMYQNAMNLRDSTPCVIDSEPIESEYQKQYFRAYHITQDVREFKQQTREYRKLLRAYSGRAVE